MISESGNFQDIGFDSAIYCLLTDVRSIKRMQPGSGLILAYQAFETCEP